jgi:hypothetical protein
VNLKTTRNGRSVHAAPVGTLGHRDYHFFGGGSSSAPPLPADPNFGAVIGPVVVRGGSAGSLWSMSSDRGSAGRVVASFGVPSFGGGGVPRSIVSSEFSVPPRAAFSVPVHEKRLGVATVSHFRARPLPDKLISFTRTV